ncbi:MAG: bifunctional hydroxymethylpyrimidine kinase/phosphomethylpyrimidine kinase [Oscillatoriales cyanobacterium C42_A2020_001]|nr:bifunctional hydroxymethylpyrimidine kinase/phosphomethylpyrimidine kinase [Leptolyngbyaceae cyanobacterium C42_A2020_001]
MQHHYSHTIVIDSKQLQTYQSINATAVKPNYHEAIQLLNLPKRADQRVEQLMPYGEALLNLTGAAIVTVTLDTEGVIVFKQNQPAFHLPTTPAPANYASGAGDTFVSALALALTANASAIAATSLATSATAIAVSQPGTTVCTAAELRQSLGSLYATLEHC